jgi:hypothetical protein
MATINIPESDSNTYKEFMAGNPVQIRAVSVDNEKEFAKGKQVKIAHLNMEAAGKIVSDPIVIDDKAKDKKVLSLVVEKVG